MASCLHSSVVVTDHEGFVPFIFVFSPALLLQGSLQVLVPTVITAILAISLLALSASGFLVKEIGWPRRALLFLAGLGLLMPVELGPMLVAFNVIGAVLAVLVLMPEWLVLARRMLKKRLPASG